MIRFMLQALALAAVLAGMGPVSTRAAATGDFALGGNAEKEACRAVERFDAPKGGAAADIYCGAWENPSGRLTVYPTEASAARALVQACPGGQTALPGSAFDSLSQVACARRQETGVTRYGLVARRGAKVVLGEVYPADWGPLLEAARVMTGLATASAVHADTGASTPGLREIQAVFPQGPPGQAAEANYELLLRRAYEYNTIWSFDAAEQDFEALLAAHNRIAADDAAGQAEIFADIALNMSNARRFAAADDAFAKAESLLRLPKDALLASKILNYRALDRLNRRDYAAGLAMAVQGQRMRADLARAEQSLRGGMITAGDVGRVERGQAGASGDRTLLVALTETPATDRALILSAQGDYIAAVAMRALGQPAERERLASAMGFLDKVVSPPGWLVEDIANEQADARLAAGDPAGAAAAAQAGLALIKTTEPGTRAEGHLWISLEQAQAAGGRVDEALASGRKAMAIFGHQTEQPGLPAEIAAPHLALLEAQWRKTGDGKLADEYFEALSLVWDSSAAHSSALLAARLALGRSGGQARAFQDAERAYRAALARQQLLAQTAGPAADKLAAADAAARSASRRLADAEAALRAQAPSYLELLNPQASAADLAALMTEREAYLRVVLAQDGGFGVLVTRTGVKPYRVALTQAAADALAERIHRTTRLRGRRLPDFDLAAGAALYQAVIAPVAADLANARDLDLDVGGALASVPFAALVEQDPTAAQLAAIQSDQDYSGVAWLGRRLAISNVLGPAALIRIRKSAPPPAGAPRAVLYGQFVPDPAGVAARLAAAKGLSAHCQDDVRRALELLGPLPETDGEVRAVAASLPGARVELGRDFTDTHVLTDPGAGEADIIMLATHGVLGLSSCIPEPGLLTSLDAKGQGLIEASQLLDRGLKAQLVVLSACDTAAGGRLDETSGGLGDGGDALSGLARGFVYAGAANVLVTEWKVDAGASSDQMAGFMRLASRRGVKLGEALAGAQAQLFDQPETAHPFYWAAFILVGDGERRLQAD